MDVERDLDFLKRDQINAQLGIQEQIEAMVVQFRDTLKKHSTQVILQTAKLPLGQEVILWTQDELMAKKEEFSQALERLFAFRQRQVFSKSFELKVAKTGWQLRLSPALTNGETWSVARNRLTLTTATIVSGDGSDEDKDEKLRKEQSMVGTTDTEWTWNLSYSQVTALVRDDKHTLLTWAAGSSGSLLHPASLLPTIGGVVMFNLSHLTCQSVHLPQLDHRVVHWVGRFAKSGLTDFTIGCWLSPGMVLLRGPNCEKPSKSPCASFATPIALVGDKGIHSIHYPENYSVQPDVSRVLFSKSGKVTIVRPEDAADVESFPMLSLKTLRIDLWSFDQWLYFLHRDCFHMVSCSAHGRLTDTHRYFWVATIDGVTGVVGSDDLDVKKWKMRGGGMRKIFQNTSGWDWECIQVWNDLVVFRASEFRGAEKLVFCSVQHGNWDVHLDQDMKLLKSFLSEDGDHLILILLIEGKRTELRHVNYEFVMSVIRRLAQKSTGSVAST